MCSTLPSMPEQPAFTRILERAANGDREAAAQVLPLVYKQLRECAQAAISRERTGHTLTATALVHEVYLKLFGSSVPPAFTSRAHFFATAAQAMRQYLIDHARARLAQKRGGPGEDHEGQPARKLSLSDMAEVADLVSLKDPAEILSLDAAVSRLEQEHARAAEVVRLRFYAGLSVEQTAEVLELSPATVKREWQFARAWLFSHLTGG